MGRLIQPVPIGYTRFLETQGRFTFIAAKQIEIVIATALAGHQVCQIIFNKSDGSIFVQTPHFRKRDGIVARFEQPAGISGSVTYNFQESGKVTSHLAKLSHHPDGRVHFSQDRKIKTEIIRTSFNLAESIGPIFELHAFFLAGFDTISYGKKGRAYVPFVFGNGIPFGITLTAQWRRKADLLANTRPPDGNIGPINQVFNRRTNSQNVAYFVGQPDGYPLREHVLILEASASRLPNGVDSETLILMGGWDPTEIKEGEPDRKQTGFLAAMYPVSDRESLASRIGTLDLQ